MRDLIETVALAGRILKELDGKIRVPGQKRKDELLRHLTAEEWEQVKSLVAEHDLPCTLESTGFGFTFALRVFAHTEALPEARPELETLLVIEREQFPFPHETGADVCKALRDAFSFVRRPRNIEVLTFYRQRVPTNIHDYTY